MMTLRGTGRLATFARIEGKGLGVWTFLAAVLQIITGRMAMTVVDGVVSFTGDAVPFVVFMMCFGLYFAAFNPNVNMPQFGRALPMTSRQEVMCSLIVLFQYLFWILCYLAIVTLIIISSAGWHNLQIDFSNWKGVAVSLEFYLIVFGCLFPISFIKKRGRRNVGFLIVALIIIVAELVLINWAKEFTGFYTYGMTWQELSSCRDGVWIFATFGILAICFTIGGIGAAFRIHRPRRY